MSELSGLKKQAIDELFAVVAAGLVGDCEFCEDYCCGLCEGEAADTNTSGCWRPMATGTGDPAYFGESETEIPTPEGRGSPRPAESGRVAHSAAAPGADVGDPPPPGAAPPFFDTPPQGGPRAAATEDGQGSSSLANGGTHRVCAADEDRAAREMHQARPDPGRPSVFSPSFDLGGLHT